MASFKSSTVGKVVEFGSVLSLFDNTWSTVKEWTWAIGIKGGYIKVAEKAAQSIQPAGEITPFKTLVEPFLADVATGGIVLATAADKAERSGCDAEANPELYQYTNRAIF